MPVFNIAANTQRNDPVGAMYEGKAVRLALKNKDLANQALQQEIDANLPERDMAYKEGALRERIGENMRALQDDQREAVERGSAAMKWAKEEGKSEEEIQAVFWAGSGLDPNKESDGLPDGRIPLEFAEAVVAARDYELSSASNGAQTKFIGDDGKAHVGTYDPVNRTYTDASGKQHTNASPIAPQATQSELGFGGGAGDKTADRNAREVIGGAENLISSVDRISEQVDEMSQSAMGLPGTITAVIDDTTNAMVGFSQMLGGDAVIGNDVVSEEMLLDVRLYRDAFAGPAAENAALKANAVGLAYALARAANPDGRISDADVRHQLERVKLDNSSKTQIQAAIKEVRREVLVNVSNHLRVGGYTKTEEGQAAYQKYMKELEKMDAAIVTPEGQKIEDVPSDDLRKALGIS